jgi:parallel beta-helix repeat protein
MIIAKQLTLKINYGGIMKSNFILRIASIFAAFIFYSVSLTAQPSGGPYGPIVRKYELPKIPGKIYYVAPDGKAENSGETVSNPTNINAVIERVKTGDAVIMRGGIYRTGNLVFNQGITIQPYQDEQPILKGTFIADKWEDLGNGLWTTSWKYLFPLKPDSWWRRNREGKKTPLHRFNNDMVFVDGKFLQSAGWEGEVNENSFYIDYETGTVYIGINPVNKLVEITAFSVALLRTTKQVHGKTSDNKGPIIKGITFTQYAYRAIEIEGTDPEGLSNEANHGKEVIGSVFENCTITFCSRVAGYFRGDHMIIRNCRISDTSTEGVYLIGSSDVLLEKNIFTRNNIERITGYYPAAVKIFNQCYRVTCNDNLVIDLPYSNGIWYDVGNVDGVFINNWVEGVGDLNTPFSIERPWPSDNGFFFEISKGAICAGNVFVNCDHGVWALNSSNVKFYQNTFINSTACVSRNERSAAGDHFGWHPSTGPDVDEREGHEFVNNLLTADENFKRPLLYVWQSRAVCEQLTQSQLKKLDYNVYVRSSDTTNPLIWWSPVKNDKCSASYNSLNEFQKNYKDFSVHGSFFHNYKGPLFKSWDLGNYELIESFPGAEESGPIPPEVVKLIGKTDSHIGAFPRD